MVKPPVGAPRLSRVCLGWAEARGSTVDFACGLAWALAWTVGRFGDGFGAGDGLGEFGTALPFIKR
jgi:hypothetical protein